MIEVIDLIALISDAETVEKGNEIGAILREFNEKLMATGKPDFSIANRLPREREELRKVMEALVLAYETPQSAGQMTK